MSFDRQNLPALPSTVSWRDRVHPVPPRHVLRDEVRAWGRGRSWHVRAPLLLWFAWIVSRHLGDPHYVSLFWGLNLGLHELGHLLLWPLGSTLSVAGGTLVQLAAPILAAYLFHRQRDYFAVSVALFWLGTGLMDVGVYAADARAMALPLVSPGPGDPLHDWNHLLGRMGALEADRAIGWVLQKAGLAYMISGIVMGAWVLRVMAGADARPSAAGARPPA